MLNTEDAIICETTRLFPDRRIESRTIVRELLSTTIHDDGYGHETLTRSISKKSLLAPALDDEITPVDLHSDQYACEGDSTMIGWSVRVD